MKVCSHVEVRAAVVNCSCVSVCEIPQDYSTVSVHTSSHASHLTLVDENKCMQLLSPLQLPSATYLRGAGVCLNGRLPERSGFDQPRHIEHAYLANYRIRSLWHSSCWRPMVGGQPLVDRDVLSPACTHPAPLQLYRQVYSDWAAHTVLIHCWGPPIH